MTGTLAFQPPSPAIDAATPARARTRFARPVHALLGLPFDAIGLDVAVEAVRAAANENRRCFVSTPNLNFLIAARTDAAFRGSVLRSDLSLVDGMPLVWLARCVGLPIHARVAGASLFEALRAGEGKPIDVFFFGGPAGAAEAAGVALNATPGGLRCVGSDGAGFGSLDDMSTPERIARINRSGAEFVVVSLGARKGQAWIERNARALEAPVLCHLGAVVNFVAGRVSRAPRWMQVIGGEWVWRIAQEPALWRRYAGDALALSRLLVTHVLPQATRRAAASAAPARLEVCRATAAVTTLHLHGSWTSLHLAPLRDALADAIERSMSLRIGLGGVTDIDASCIGLLMLAHGDLATRVVLHDVPDRIVATLQRHGAEFLLDPGAPA